eukprot:gnl/Dysnectes_brevis/1769_a2022_2160.p1 GENE.gnl/Dysnectes_brevis/1769_a2022_2160~~gnl/Dysnectes_brevis/1769_a2022_2160.p1  ORF type:complete len:228 (+),score=58.38 gnl/Dysnectes_brevis/1769_a2022_2160:744-1427(+)
MDFDKAPSILSRQKSSGRLFRQQISLPAVAEADHDETTEDRPLYEELLTNMSQVAFSIAWNNRDPSTIPIVLSGNTESPISLPRAILPICIGSSLGPDGGYPPFICFSVGNGRRLLSAVQETEELTVNYISQDLKDAEDIIIKNYFDKEVDHEEDILGRIGVKILTSRFVSAPIISASMVSFECVVDRFVEVGDHTLVICEVTASYIAKQLIPKGRPKRSRRFSIAL